jgi:hypothetical protein
MCQKCYYHIRDLQRIRRHLPLSDAKTVATVLVDSLLDYYNSLVHDLALKDNKKLKVFKIV